MAGARSVGRSTRSRKTTAPDGFSDELADEPVTRSLRSKNAVPSVLRKKVNCEVVITKLRSELKNTTKDAKVHLRSVRRKRRRVDSEDETGVEAEETRAKKTKGAQKKGKAASGIRNGGRSTSKQRKVKKNVTYTEGPQGSSSHSEAENDNESVADSESGMASGYKSSSSLSSSTDRESDSPVPTSELSEGSHKNSGSSDESSSSDSDVVTWRTRKSPRKQAQASSRKKIAELCKSDSEDTSSSSSSESSYSE